MAELVDDFGDPDRSGRAGWLARLAHLLPVFMVFYLVVEALGWVEVLRIEELPFYLRILLIFPTPLIVIIAFLHQDFSRLCLRCMEDVPADAGLRVATPRKRVSLKLFHLFATRRRVWLPLVLIISYDLAVAVGLGLLGINYLNHSWVTAPSGLFIAWFTWATWVHHRYRPWCPYCKPWDDDGGIREPSPDPTTSGTKVTS